jgi:hypothetical protein
MPDKPSGQGRKLHALTTGLIGTAILLALYLAAAYLIAPFAWTEHEKHHPSFDESPRVTKLKDGHPGDPLNVALIGTEAEIKTIMAAANWTPAAALALKSDLKIAADTVLKRTDDDAPVSNLYLFGRREDLAFEKPVGNNPRQRNHVRFWQVPDMESDGKPIWVGGASYDESVGFSHTTGQITHHIAPDVDTERDELFADLEKTGDLSDTYKVPDFHKVLEGRNGGGDPWHTDGALWVGVIGGQ